MCGECHAAHPAKEKAKQEAAEKAERFLRVIQLTSKVTASTITDLAIELENQFGSIREFAAFYKGQLQIAAAGSKGAGSARVLTACASIAKIIAASTAYQSTLPDISAMTDIEVAEEIKATMVNLLRRLPREEIEDLLETEPNGQKQLIEDTA